MRIPLFRAIAGAVAAFVIAAICLPEIGLSQAVGGAPVVSQAFSLTTGNIGLSGPVLNLVAGQQTCFITIYSGASFSITAQVASDGPTSPSTWSTATNLGTSGVITATGTTGGAVNGQGITNFRFILTALGAGQPLTGVESCSTAGGGGSGGGGNVTVVNTPGVVCISGCSGGAAPTPLPTASAGVVPTNAPPVISEQTCNFPAGSAPVVTPGNQIAVQCDNAGNQKVNCVTGCSAQAATPLPTASAGLPPVNAPPVVSQNTCMYPAGNAPTVTVGNSIAMQCDVNGNTKVNVQAVPSPSPCPSPGCSVAAFVNSTGQAQGIIADNPANAGCNGSIAGLPCFVTLTNTTATTLVTGVTGKQVRIMGLTVTNSSASTININVGYGSTSTCTGFTITQTYVVPTVGGFVHVPSVAPIGTYPSGDYVCVSESATATNLLVVAEVAIF